MTFVPPSRGLRALSGILARANPHRRRSLYRFGLRERYRASKGLAPSYAANPKRTTIRRAFCNVAVSTMVRNPLLYLALPLVAVIYVIIFINLF